MIKCNLARMLGEKTLKISEVSRQTGINRGTITRLYQNTAIRVEFDVLEKLCRFLECEISDFLKVIDDPQ
jgi:putative transcriptional regulator